MMYTCEQCQEAQSWSPFEDTCDDCWELNNKYKDMLNQKQIIDNILSVPTKKRVRLVHDVQNHATAQCNGDYWYDDDAQSWSGVYATRGENLEKSIIKRLYEYSSGIIGVVTARVTVDLLPDFISYNNDPRGIVLKIETQKLSEEARQYCRDSNLLMDWGGDYGILLNNEIKN